MISRSLTAIFVYVMAANICFAGFWDFIKFWEDERVDTLIITGNYTRSRLLAELIQQEDDTPILLFSPDAFKNKFYYLSDDKKAAEYSTQRLAEFMSFINPKSVVVIGDEKYVGKDVISLLDRSTAPWTSIEGSNWTANAQFAAKHFDIDGLTQEYSRLLLQIYEGVGTETEVSDTPAIVETEPVMEETPLAVEVDEINPVVETPIVSEPEAVEPEVVIENDEGQIEVIEQTPQK